MEAKSSVQSVEQNEDISMELHEEKRDEVDDDTCCNSTSLEVEPFIPWNVEANGTVAIGMSRVYAVLYQIVRI
eukprot:CAMPEP_0184755038 /NCGR_PEP_ID=MMETSP0315-20130426/44943_1 /TAXON_ID=101924 /ORGANISM="Rhodosorus marinus, Strain UTEX LB 2760" /LENGTH=72 /DNA_ID=CAMNT_0027234499 /DNA_START=774 /DNA_END=992 /DNA_ORIENTATION=-